MASAFKLPDGTVEKQDTAPVVAPALGYSILANLGDEKQITVQCFADSEEPLGSIHNKIDKAMAVIDRQKAKHKIKDLTANSEKMEATLRQLEEDLNRLEGDYEKKQEAIDKRVTELVGQREALQVEAHERGRSAPVGADHAGYRNAGKEIENLKEQRDKAAAERNQAREQIAVSIVRYREEIAKHKEQIAECEKLIAADG